MRFQGAREQGSLDGRKRTPPWTSFIHRGTSTEVRAAVKNSSQAKISEAEIAGQNKETARVMETIQKEQQEQIEEFGNIDQSHAEDGSAPGRHNGGTERARPKHRGDNQQNEDEVAVQIQPIHSGKKKRAPEQAGQHEQASLNSR